MNIFPKTTLTLTAFAVLTTLPVSAQTAPFSFFGTGVDCARQ